MSPGTEYTRDFCAGIGPLQLGVVLVLFSFICFSYYMYITVYYFAFWHVAYNKHLNLLNLLLTDRALLLTQVIANDLNMVSSLALATSRDPIYFLF